MGLCYRMENRLSAIINWAPLLRLAIMAFSLSGAFVSGCVFSIGIAFLPIIDKGELLLIVAFYGSSLLLAFSVCRSLFIANQKFPDISKSKKLRILLLSLPIALFAFILFAIGSELLYFLIDQGGLRNKIFIACLILSIVIIVLWVNTKIESYLRTFVGLCIALFFVIGIIYVDFLRYAGPQAQITTKQGREFSAVIGFRAADGFIIFRSEDRLTYFLPTADIALIMSTR